MKKPEEIKKGLKCCYETDSCYGKCPYDNPQSDICECTSTLAKDAVAYIEQLEAQLAKQNNLIDVLEEENDENT